MMTLMQVFAATAGLRAEWRANGMDDHALALATETFVRQELYVAREWKFLCQQCRDYGCEFLECPGDATCGRDREHLPHAYIAPCWCSAGAKFRKPAHAEQDFTQAGKTPKKPREFTRFGR